MWILSYILPVFISGSFRELCEDWKYFGQKFSSLKIKKEFYNVLVDYKYKLSVKYYKENEKELIEILKDVIE